MQRIPAHLSFLAEERGEGQAGLRALGIPPDAPRVCLFGRDSRYLETVMGALGDADYQRSRNMDVQTFRAAALALAERGYAVVRMGSLVKEALDVSHPMVFDYATCGMRSDFMDIYLAATCRFFVGVPSGLIHIPIIFRTPCVYVNLVRLELMHFCDPQDISIFKRFRRKADNRCLSIRELVDSGRACRPIELFVEDDEVEIVDNTEEEICEAVLEMHERLEGTWRDSPDDASLQQMFRSYFKVSEHNSAFNSLVGVLFLRRHCELLCENLSQRHG